MNANALPATLQTADGLALHLQHGPTAAAPARGTMLIVHGLGEHIGRYAHVAAHLNAWGWNVLGYDHRGHGRSEGGRGRIVHAASLLEDLALVVDAARTTHPGRLLLLGHSMGGCVAARFVAEGTVASPAAWHRPVDGLVLSSPALQLALNPAQRLALAALHATAPNLAIGNGLKREWISRSAAVVAAYQADPLVHDRITPQLLRFMLDAGEFSRACAPRWVLPTLLLWAGADRCVSPAGSASFAAAAPAGVITAKEFPQMAHEIFNEPEQAEVFAALRSWLEGLN